MSSGSACVFVWQLLRSQVFLHPTSTQEDRVLKTMRGGNLDIEAYYETSIA